MKCFFCKGLMENGATTYVADLGTCVIIIRNVPCRKCTQCGETPFSLDVGERLEQITDALKDSVSEVAIVNYTDTAA